MIETYNEYHLGDQLVHLNYLRRLSKLVDGDIIHYCNPMHHAQLAPLVEDTAIVLRDLVRSPHAQNAWIGHANYFYEHPHRHDWVNFHIDWFTRLSCVLGVPNPIASRSDLLFEYPALNRPWDADFDYLICNSPPQSNQLPDYTPDFFKKMIQNLTNEGKTVITTHPTGMTACTLDQGLDVTGIGSLSKYCRHHVGVATGPMWTTFNVYSLDKVLSRTWYCAHQTLDLTDNTVTLQKL